MPLPFFSIITVSFNAEDTIAKTVTSALNQDFSNFEIIVKDGCSNDKTLENIPNDCRIKVHSIKDSGIYDAMNQATKLALGEYVIYMNCGDLFAENTVLSTIYNAIKESKPSMVYGNYLRDKIVHKQPGVLTKFYMYRTPLCHQTIFFNRNDLIQTGLYDVKYRILGDYDAELRLFFSGKEYQYADTVVCKYLGGGVSESKSGIDKKNKERKEILKKYFPRNLRVLYKIKWLMSFPKFRGYIVGGKSPLWLKNLYQKTVNRVNK
jgi:glycosyltransferase involved in cell wall biosynthesis